MRLKDARGRRLDVATDNPTPRQQARQFFRSLREETRDQDELEAFRLAMRRDMAVAELEGQEPYAEVEDAQA
jgi:hypothetical protein